MPEVVAYPEGDNLFVMTQPPFSDVEDESADRILRVFHRPEGRPIPPDR
jgi:hypothetical protein